MNEKQVKNDRKGGKVKRQKNQTVKEKDKDKDSEEGNKLQKKQRNKGEKIKERKKKTSKERAVEIILKRERKKLRKME